jgi:EpsI family protein
MRWDRGLSVSNWYRAALSCALLISAWLFLQLRSYGEAVPIHKPLDAFPLLVGDWQGQQGVVFEGEVLNILKVRDYLMRRYIDPSGRSLWLYIGYWDAQRKGAQMHSPKHCLPGGGWAPLEATRVPIPLSASRGAIEVNRYLIQKDHYQQLVLYWYQSRGQVMASEIDAKLQLIKNAVFHNRTDGALIRITSPISGSVQETFEQQIRYVQAMFPILSQFLPD